MVRTASRPGTLVLCAVALGLALAALLVVRPESSVAAHEDCTLSAFGPGSYYGIYASTSGSVDCAVAKNVIHFSLALTRDGTVVDSGDRTCHRTATCWSYAIANDPPGDQVWCSIVSARVGPHSLGTVTRCEADPNL